MESQFTNIKKEGKELLDTLDDLSKPSRPENDNHETGFWKGAAIIAVAAAVGFGVIAFTAVKKD